jgi:integrase
LRAKHRLLTQLAVDKAKARSQRYELPDGPGGVPGLALRISEHGAKTFALRYRVGGRQRRITIGAHAAMTLRAARTTARAALEMASRGEDPTAAKEANQERDRNSVTAVVAAYVERHLKRNTRRWRDIEQMLARDVLPHWGDRPMASITRRDILDLIDGIVDRGSPVSANRVLSRIKALFTWSVERGVIEYNPAAGIKEPHREKPRDKTLTEPELRAIWGAFEAMGWPFGPLGKLLILLAQRRGETSSMRWDQLDLDAAIWRLEASDTKAERSHIVPLAPAAVELLRQLPHLDRSPLVFPSERLASDRPVSGFSKALRTAQRLSGTSGWTFHDLRRSAATGMAKLAVAPHVTEKILNHRGGHALSQLARVYNTYSYGDEARRALEMWAAEVERIVTGGEAKVVALRRA